MSLTRYMLFGAGLTAGLLTMTGTASAADDGYQDVFSSVLTAVGVMQSDSSPEIDYRERAPLVLPPKMALEKPVPAGAARTAAWPQDPDVLKRRKAAEEARAPLPDILGNPGTLLSKEELAKGRTAAIPTSSTRRDRCGNDGNQRGCLVIDPDELRAEGERMSAAGLGSTKSDLLVAGQEPDRLYLTQPPKGYLKATKSVKATAEAPKMYHDEANPSSALVYRPKEDQ